MVSAVLDHASDDRGERHAARGAGRVDDEKAALARERAVLAVDPPAVRERPLSLAGSARLADEERRVLREIRREQLRLLAHGLVGVLRDERAGGAPMTGDHVLGERARGRALFGPRRMRRAAADQADHEAGESRSAHRS